jgi:hypothetical protein
MAGLCAGLLRFQTEMDSEGKIPIGKTLVWTGIGALCGFVAGVVIWGFAKELERGILFLRVLAIALVVTGMGTGLGWGIGAQTGSGLYWDVRDRPRGMLYGAIVGVFIGLFLGLINLRSKAKGRFRTIYGRPDNPSASNEVTDSPNTSSRG